MKKLSLFMMFGIAFLLISTTFILAKTDNDKNPFNQMIEKLTEILAQLEIIADKETNVEVNVEPPIVNIEPNITVEPPEVTVNPDITIEGNNEMSKRGNIVLKGIEYVGLANPKEVYPTKSSRTFYVALPNGECSITLSTNGVNLNVREAKSTNGLRGSFNGENGILTIDDEYYMVKISANDYHYLSLAYNCI